MRIVFMGTPESAVPTLRRLVADGHQITAVWTQPDKPAGRGKKLHQSPIKQLASELKLPIFQPAKIKTEQAKQLFASHDADLAIVVAYGKLLPDEFLTAPKRGCVNVHFSLLPKYRGAAPVNWAIVNGEEQTGVTTMKIVAELDAGPILLQSATKIAPSETTPELLSRLCELGAQLLSETLQNFESIDPKPQINEQASFAPILKRADGHIDWTMDAAAIERRVRGFQPWPNAYTSLGAQRLTIFKAVAETIDNFSSDSAGRIINAHRDDLRVSCGNGTVLRVLELQLEGSRRMGVRDFLNGKHAVVGVRLG